MLTFLGAQGRQSNEAAVKRRHILRRHPVLWSACSGIDDLRSGHVISFDHRQEQTSIPQPDGSPKLRCGDAARHLFDNGVSGRSGDERMIKILAVVYAVFVAGTVYGMPYKSVFFGDLALSNLRVRTH